MVLLAKMFDAIDIYHGSDDPAESYLFPFSLPKLFMQPSRQVPRHMRCPALQDGFRYPKLLPLRENGAYMNWWWPGIGVEIISILYFQAEAKLLSLNELCVCSCASCSASALDNVLSCLLLCMCSLAFCSAFPLVYLAVR